MNRIFLTLLVALMVAGSASAQDASQNAFTFSGGVGALDVRETSGMGGVFGIGYQASVLSERLRFHPSVSFGSYSDASDDAPQAFYRSIIARADLNFDIIKIRSFSLFIGAGLFANDVRGLIGRSYYFSNGGSILHFSSERYFNKRDTGGAGMVGFRVNPASGRFAFELVPLSISVGFINEHLMVDSQIRLLYKLN